MTTPQDMVSDLQDVPELVEAQVAAGLDRDDVFMQLFNAWADRLAKHTKMAPKGKIAVTQAINSGPWTASQKKDLAGVLHFTASSKTNSARRPCQKVKHPENFIRTSVTAKLRSKLGRASKLSLLATEMRNIGIENADEPLLFRLVQILAWAEDDWGMTQDDILQYMDNLQSYIKAVPRNKELEYIEHYPASAELLTPKFQAIAFPDKNIPVPVDLPELDNILAGNKMRGRKASKNHPSIPKWLEHVPEEHKSSVMLALKKSSSSASISSLPDSPTPEKPTPPSMSADAFRFTAPPAIENAKMKSDATSKGEPMGVDDTDSDDEADGVACSNTIDDMEKTMIAARSGLRAKIMKRPAAAKSVLKRKPASSTSSTAVQKKPATKGKTKTAPMKAIGTWKIVHSRIYHRTRDAVYKKTGDHEKAKDAASAACTKAKVKFLANTLKLD